MRNSLFTILLIGLRALLSAGDWRMYLHDPAHSSFNDTETHLDKDSIQSVQNVWLFTPGASALLAAAATLNDGVLYFGDWTGNFHAVRASDGTELWRASVGFAAPPPDPGCQPPLGVTSQAVVVDRTVYVGGGDSALYALDKTTGQRVFRVPLADPNGGSLTWLKHQSIALNRAVRPSVRPLIVPVEKSVFPC